MITAKQFGKTADGRTVTAYTLHDGVSSMTVLDLGGIVQQISVPDKNGDLTDVILGYNSVEGYENNGGYLGALIGRFGNRIGGGRLVIDGKEYGLYLNDRGNHLHGGKEGFDKKIWNAEIVGDKLKLSILSPDMEENYPGNLKVEVIYSFAGGEWKIEYRAVSDKKTCVNLTNHAYFNLGGEGKGDILGHLLQIDCDCITPTSPTMIPEGGYRAVKGTAFDFNTQKEIGKDIEADDVDLKQGEGYDHCHVLKNKCGEYVKYAEAMCPETGIVMECFTDMPAVQFYAGNFLSQEGKSGFYGKRCGFCLETQAIPNNVNVPEYAERGSSILEAGQEYKFSAAYRFSVKK